MVGVSTVGVVRFDADERLLRVEGRLFPLSDRVIVAGVISYEFKLISNATVKIQIKTNNRPLDQKQLVIFQLFKTLRLFEQGMHLCVGCVSPLQLQPPTCMSLSSPFFISKLHPNKGIQMAKKRPSSENKITIAAVT